MSEEEKKAIEKLKEYALCKVNDNGYVEVSANGYKHTILNLIENQQKELDNLKEIEKSHKEENGKLRVEFDELEKTLKQTQDSWFEDTQKLEQEKEKNKAFHKFIMFTGGKDIKDFSATEYMRIRQEAYIDGRAYEKQKAEEIIMKNYISKYKIEKVRKNYLKKALDIESLNMFKGTTEKEREEIKFYRNIAEILKLILKEV